MMRRISVVALIIALLLPLDLLAQKSRSSSKSKSSSSKTVHIKQTKASKPSTTPRKSTVAARDKNGRIKRSMSARNDFMRQTGYPKGRKGYVVDHIVPLECGGTDAPFEHAMADSSGSED